MRKEIKIQPLTPESINDFFLYLHDHISDNGKNNTPLFLPISRADLGIPKGLKDSFLEGQAISLDQLGWRRVFIAVNKQDEICGHIDLKSHNQPYTHHRAILGMGVHRDYRQMGLGSLLMETIIAWAKDETAIQWIDLQVLSENSPAIRLYEKLGFEKIGEVKDMFRIDGNSLDYLMMAKKII